MTFATTIAAGASLFTGYAGMQAANYQAKVGEYNASIATDNAARATELAQIEQQDFDNESAGLQGSILATQGASGLASSGRSAILSRKASAELNRKDALNIIQAGQLESSNLHQEAANLKAEARAAKVQGKVGMISSIFDAGSSLLGGAKASGFKQDYMGQPARRTRSLATTKTSHAGRIGK